MKQLQKLVPTLAALLGFIILSVGYFSPVLQGKKIFQSDIVQYVGMAKEQNDFRDTYHCEPYWTNSAFGGMPTYQLGAHYPNDFVGALDDVIRFLPRPADYLFLYFLGFFVLLRVLKADNLLAFFGALAFGFSTYLIVILGVGHNAKAHAIGYIPMVLAGSILLFRKNYVWGTALTMLAWALEINANHFQMTYYSLFLLLPIGLYFLWPYVKTQQWKTLIQIKSLYIGALILAFGLNATALMATKEYADFSTRSQSELSTNPDGTPKTDTKGLSRDYITEYSYGKAESFDLIAPRLFGGSNAEELGKESRMYQFVEEQGGSAEEAADFAGHAPTYWGDQPIVAAPAYIGVTVFFLALLGLFHDQRKLKWAFAAGAILSLVLSWGKNFAFLTDLLIDYMPLYNKFRAVSSIQVLLELCLPVLAVMGLQSFLSQDENRLKNLYKTAGTALGLFVLLMLCKNQFDFNGPSDAYYLKAYGDLGGPFVEALKADRMSLYSADILRGIFFVVALSAICWLYVKGKIKPSVVTIACGVLLLGDLVFIDKKYVNKEDFVAASQVDKPFDPSPSDEAILKDTTHYRVFEVDENLNGARTSYFHHSIGGYHAAKPRRMQQLFDYQIANNNREVLDMLNIKYIIQTDKDGKQFPTINADANGNAWFVEKLRMCQTADDEMRALQHFNSKKTAIVNEADWKTLCINQNQWAVDTTAALQTTLYWSNQITLKTNQPQDGFLVVSEMYYPNGWNAYIDGKPVAHCRVDYALRGLAVPKGPHTVMFKFEPSLIQTGSTITLACSLLIVLLSIGLVFWIRKHPNWVHNPF